jgi:uncharacterized protein (TIGR02680 family)
VVDLFYYDQEEFQFHDGRLLLRGNNGTGKSKVLALTVPFLLDGELAAHRVEPDGDRAKRMEWNLLLGGKHPHNERLGYSWLEFGRITEHGAEYRTIGCGLKAVAGKGIAKHWFFLTSARVGGELSLVSPTRVALTREKLKDALDGTGTVYDTASDYRRAVDEALFGLGTHRYEALVNLLIQLRQPQLSKKPDEKLLSRALTTALPPLDATLVTTVANAFRGLDEERAQLSALAEARIAADAFLHHYRRYARIAAKRWAEPPRLTHSRYERLGADLREAEAVYQKADTEFIEVTARLDELDSDRARLESRRTALHDSPAMRDAKALTDAGNEAERLRRFASSRVDDRDEADRTVARRERDLVTAQQRAADDQRMYDRADADAGQAADTAGVSDGHATVLTALADDASPYPTAVRAGGGLVDSRSAAVDQLHRLLVATEAAERELRTARGTVDRITGEQQAAAVRILAGESRVSNEITTLATAYSTYLGGATYLRVPDSDAVLAAVDAWADTVDGPNPGAAALDDVLRAVTAEVARQQAAVEARTAAARQQRAAVRDEIDRLERGGHDVPPLSDTREVSARENRPGAPLWKVVDFAASVPDDHRAGIEAGLQAAGILDAWLTPTGELRDGLTDDVLVVPGEAVVDGGLTAVLRPAVDRGDPLAAVLADDVVAAALAGIGLRSGPATWVAVDGRFGIGVLSGSWHKDAAVYIGEGAREAARRARLAELRTELAVLDARLGELAAETVELAARQDAIGAEYQARPTDTALREAHLALAGEHQAKRDVDERLREAEEERLLRAATHRETSDAAVEFAGDVGLPAEMSLLADVRAALGDYRVALAALWPARRTIDRAREGVDAADEELRTAAERRELLRDAALGATAAADVAEERHRVLVETAGAAVDEVVPEARVCRRGPQSQRRPDEAGSGGRAAGDRGARDGERPP